MTTLNPIEPHALKQKLDTDAAILIDVRESDEHAREHIIGMRTQANAAQLIARGFREAYYLDGGVEAWKDAGPPVHTNKQAPLEIMRQVQIAAGALILIGVGLGWLVSQNFFALSAFVGAGLFFAGLSGWCGMALLLKAMPWNRASLGS